MADATVWHLLHTGSRICIAHGMTAAVAGCSVAHSLWLCSRHYKSKVLKSRQIADPKPCGICLAWTQQNFCGGFFIFFFFPGLQRLPLTTALLQPQKLTYKQTSANSGQPAEFYSLHKQLSIIRPDEPLVIAAAARRRKIPKLRTFISRNWGVRPEASFTFGEPPDLFIWGPLVTCFDRWWRFRSG